jgi:hypothetical protein
MLALLSRLRVAFFAFLTISASFGTPMPFLLFTSRKGGGVSRSLLE